MAGSQLQLSSTSNDLLGDLWSICRYRELDGVQSVIRYGLRLHSTLQFQGKECISHLLSRTWNLDPTCMKRAHLNTSELASEDTGSQLEMNLLK